MPQPLILKTPLKGLVTDFAGGYNGSVEGKRFEYARSNGIDLLRQGFEGHISSAEIFNSPAPITNANINSHIRNFASDPINSATYLILGGLTAGVAPRVERLESGVYASTASHAITEHGGANFTTLPSGTGFWGEDIIIYNVSGVNRVFYSWCDNTSGDIGTGTLGAGAPTYDDDFMSTVPVNYAVLYKNVPLRLCEGADRKLYFTNARYVGQYDGATNTVNTTRYDLGPGWIATDIRNHRSLLVITATHTGGSTYTIAVYGQKSRVCIWNLTEPNLGSVYDIEDGNISCSAVGEDGRLYVFTERPGDICKLRRLEDGEFRVKKQWQSTLLGKSPQPNAVTNFKGLLVFATTTSILAYDTKYDALHVPYLPNDGTNSASSMGMLKLIDTNNLTLSMKSSTTYELARLNGFSGYSSTAKDFRYCVQLLPYLSTVPHIRIFFSQMASGSSVTVSFFKNYATMSVGGSDDKLNKTLSYASNGALSEYEFSTTIADVSAFYINLRLTGQISISRIEVDYEPQK